MHTSEGGIKFLMTEIWDVFGGSGCFIAIFLVFEVETTVFFGCRRQVSCWWHTR